ncbi:hypothetical protein GCM10028801_25540 [Nocardioides maradonensis]
MSNPGLSNQTSVRTTFRILGPILAVVGLVVCISGFISFAHYDGDSAPLSQMGMFMGGFVLFAVGMGMARAGFLGVGLRYAAGEVAPVAKDGLEFLTAGKGLGNLGVAAEGPFCRGCGTRNDATAKFCDNCGATLA